MQIEQLEERASAASALLKAMSNETRLMILCKLIGKEMTAGELDKAANLSQSALSQHLAVLRQHGLVKTRREAQSIYYSLDGIESKAVIEVLFRLYNKDAS